MTDLFANKLFECRYKLYIHGGNHSRSTYQRIICELENEDPDLLASIQEANTDLSSQMPRRLKYSELDRSIANCSIQPVILTQLRNFDGFKA